MSVTLKTNFGRRVGNLVPALLLGSWGLSLAALLGAGVLVEMRAQVHATLPVLREQLKEIHARRNSLREEHVPFPPRPALVALQQRVSAINKIVSLKGLPVSDLLARMETILPPKTWLVSLHQQRAHGEVKLVVASRDVGELTLFLKRLERDPDFSDTLLTKQSSGSGKSMGVVQFEIRLMEKI